MDNNRSNTDVYIANGKLDREVRECVLGVFAEGMIMMTIAASVGVALIGLVSWL